MVTSASIAAAAWRVRSSAVGHRCAYVARPAGEPPPDPDIARLESALEAAEKRLAQRIDDEVGKLREELEYTQAQVIALGGGVPGRPGAQDRDVGT